MVNVSSDTLFFPAAPANTTAEYAAPCGVKTASRHTPPVRDNMPVAGREKYPYIAK